MDRFHTFVANRVSKIQSLTLSTQWHHVGSKDNPADILSKGLSATKLAEYSLWFHGPLFLHGNEQNWLPQFSRLLILNDKERMNHYFSSQFTRFRIKTYSELFKGH